MKKLFLSFIMLITGSNLLSMHNAGVYQPAQGPLKLEDTTDGRGNASVRGCIMKAIADNNPTNIAANLKLSAANTAIAAFDGRGQNFSSYQQIMVNISQSTNTQLAVDAIQAFETVLMHMYDYRAYLYGSYKPGRSILVTGIRYSWINPLSYFSPKNWFSDNDAELKQIIDELYNLAEIAKIHSTPLSIRLNTTAHSYRHWRRNLACAAVAYLAADAYAQGFKESIVNTVYSDGLSGCRQVACNTGTDILNGTKFGLKTGATLAQGAWSYGIKPIGKFALWGASGFTSQIIPNQEKQNISIKQKNNTSTQQKTEEKNSITTSAPTTIAITPSQNSEQNTEIEEKFELNNFVDEFSRDSQTETVVPTITNNIQDHILKNSSLPFPFFASIILKIMKAGKNGLAFVNQEYNEQLESDPTRLSQIL